MRLVMATREPARWGLDDLVPARSRSAPARAARWACSPSARALAVLRGRRYAVPQDVYDVAPEVLRHRITLTYDALAEGVHPEDVVESLLARVPAPQHLAPAGQGRTAASVTRPDGGGMSAPLLSMAASDAVGPGRRCCAASSSPSRTASRARDSGDHASCTYGPGSERSGARPYAAGRRRAARRLEPHRRAPARSGCGRPRPTASWRPGSSWTGRPASTSARPTARSATSRWAPWRRSAC